MPANDMSKQTDAHSEPPQCGYRKWALLERHLTYQISGLELTVV